MRKLLLALGLIFVVMAMTISFEPHRTPLAKEQLAPLEPRCELPCQCRHLLKDLDPDTWDPETETYPTNNEWGKCMGVR